MFIYDSVPSSCEALEGVTHALGHLPPRPRPSPLSFQAMVIQPQMAAAAAAVQRGSLPGSPMRMGRAGGGSSGGGWLPSLDADVQTGFKLGAGGGSLTSTSAALPPLLHMSRRSLKYATGGWQCAAVSTWHGRACQQCILFASHLVCIAFVVRVFCDSREGMQKNVLAPPPPPPPTGVKPYPLPLPPPAPHLSTPPPLSLQPAPSRPTTSALQL